MKVKAVCRALPAGSALVWVRMPVWPRWVHTGSSHLRPSNTNTLMKASCGDQDRHLLLLLLLLASVTNLSRSLAVPLISFLSLSLGCPWSGGGRPALQRIPLAAISSAGRTVARCPLESS